MDKIEQYFERFASWASDLLGRGLAFVVVAIGTFVALKVVPIDVVNICISVATLLMVFLLQNTQNKSDKAMHLKLDDLILRLDAPDDELAGIEDRPMTDVQDRREEITDTAEDRDKA